MATLEIEDLRASFYTRRGVVRAVDGITFSLDIGQTLGLVGESGSGKTTLASAIVGLLPPGGRIDGGTVRLDGRDLTALSPEELQEIRGRQIAMIPQDPTASLNPLFTIGDQLGESLAIGGGSRENREREVVQLLTDVKIAAPEQRVHAYPHTLSGGTRQRVVGAMGLAAGARVLIADEPTTALDVTVQAQYLALLAELQRARGLAMLFITHDLGIVAQMCDRVAVMYAGRIVEQGPTVRIFTAARHPYTQALLQALPTMSLRVERLETIEGEPPDLAALPVGCRFAPRCRHARELCVASYPPMTSFGPGHVANCWVAAEAKAAPVREGP